MDMIETGDLPKGFEDEVSRRLADFTIAFISPETPESQHQLLGSGVLVEVEKRRAVLTAHHVLARVEAEKSGRIGMLLTPTHHPHTVDRGRLHFLKIGRGRADHEGPDLGAILVLDPEVESSIAAKKSFYNMTSRRQRALENPPPPEDGVWAANG
jgi:hypothetical protein